MERFRRGREYATLVSAFTSSWFPCCRWIIVSKKSMTSWLEEQARRASSDCFSKANANRRMTSLPSPRKAPTRRQSARKFSLLASPSWSRRVATSSVLSPRLSRCARMLGIMPRFLPSRTSSLACFCIWLRFRMIFGLSPPAAFSASSSSSRTMNMVSASVKKESSVAIKFGRKGQNSTWLLVSCDTQRSRLSVCCPCGFRSHRCFTTALSAGASSTPCTPWQKVGTGSWNSCGCTPPKLRSSRLL
mmetsp:Transcript_17684/g.42006  ORF Transcript_17684/g.42006 Transcript_17684/m.42006 type:complete len:246 (-) Transcript_17684:103-840(-)